MSETSGRGRALAKEGLQAAGRSGRLVGWASLSLVKPAPLCCAHHDFGEDVPSVLALSRQSQRAQSLRQPGRHAGPRGPRLASWRHARALADAVGDRDARRLGVGRGSGTLQERGGVWSQRPGDRPGGGGGDPNCCLSPASSRLASRPEPSAHLFPPELRTCGGRFKRACTHACRAPGQVRRQWRTPLQT